MRVTRLVLACASFTFLFVLFALQTSCGDEKRARAEKIKVTCATVIDVDANTGANPVDAYICSDTTVTWNANGHKFHVFFKKNLCPFEGGCKGINDQHPTSSKVKAISTLTVFDYGIVVDDDVFDPHVVGGGGT